jgi:uncharacterized protein (DUF1778 family)
MHPHHDEYVRLSCRVSARIKSRAEEAAALLGQSITDFTEAALADKAQSVLDQHERIILSARDFARFVASIESPKEPSQKLSEAWDEYEEMKVKHPESNL